MNTPFPTRSIGIVAFPGAEVLDITGPYEVFAFANIILQKEGVIQETAYSVTVLAERPGPAHDFVNSWIDHIILSDKLVDSAINQAEKNKIAQAVIS